MDEVQVDVPQPTGVKGSTDRRLDVVQTVVVLFGNKSQVKLIRQPKRGVREL
jgi:hypothetical protein